MTTVVLVAPWNKPRSMSHRGQPTRPISTIYRPWSHRSNHNSARHQRYTDRYWA